MKNIIVIKHNYIGKLSEHHHPASFNQGKFMLSPYSIDQFSPHVGSVFVVHTQHGMQKLKLYKATELPRRGLPDIFPTPFSILLSSERDVKLEQDTYVLDHPQLGRVEWMMVPVMAPTSVPRVDMQQTYYYYEVLFC